MNLSKETSEFCEKKFKFLLTYFDSEANVTNGGIKGVSTKNGSFNKYYDSISRFTPDGRYFFWMEFIKAKDKSEEIKIFTTKPDGKIFHLVINGKENRFLDVYPEGVKI